MSERDWANVMFVSQFRRVRAFLTYANSDKDGGGKGLAYSRRQFVASTNCEDSSVMTVFTRKRVPSRDASNESMSHGAGGIAGRNRICGVPKFSVPRSALTETE